jgi:phosphate starvation-inducible PhoH-like protein
MALLDLDLLEPEVMNRPSRKKGRVNSKEKKNNQTGGGNNFQLKLKKISPLTNNQRATFKAFEEGKNLLLHGYAGTGKTFLSLYLALSDVLSQGSYYKKVVIIRSAVPSRDMGFLPGNFKEKMKQYEEPYVQICTELFGRGDAYGILTGKGVIEFTTTSYLRGLTFNDAIVIVDECQNNNFGELNTVITRLGDNSRIIIAGDYRQNDLNKKYDESGLPSFMKIIHSMKSFGDIDFQIDDIVRGGTVKEYIIAKERLGL